jgi:hypothetical protein
LDVHGVLPDVQRIHPAAEFQVHPARHRALRERAIELGFIDHLGKGSFRSVLQLPSPGRYCLYAVDVGQNGVGRKLKSGKSFVTDHAGADRFLADAVLGFQKGNI